MFLEHLFLEDKTYGYCGDWTYPKGLFWEYDNNDTLTIKGEATMASFSFGSVPWEKYRDQIKIVIIKDGAKNIGDYAFCSCENLTSITIPDSVEIIGRLSFHGCRSLTHINIPATFIGDYAFCGCENLQEVNLPECLLEVGEYAFGRCENLTEIKIPDKVINVYEGAFSDCKKLARVVMPTCVLERVGYRIFHAKVFKNCESLTDIEWPLGAPYICPETFSGCKNLKRIKLPEGIMNIHAWVLDGDGDMSTGFQWIGYEAFKYCENLTDINLPDSITDIGDRAFYGCSSLTEIKLPVNLKEIAEEAFSGCNNLTKITIPDRVTIIGKEAFSFCKSLTEIKLPVNLKEIAEWAFSGCESLIEITIPKDIITIGEGTFCDCENLTEIMLPDGLINIYKDAFYNCKNLKRIIIPSSVVEFSGAFDENFTTVYRKIGANFADGLKIGNGDKIFSCYKLKPSAFVKIMSFPIFESDDKYYAGKIKLSDSFGRTAEVEIAAGIFEGFKFTAKGADTFKIDLNSKKLIWKLDDNTLTIGGTTEIKTFSNETISLENIRKIVIVEGVEKISERAFIGCKNVNEVIIPDSVTTISDLAFTVSFCGNSAVNGGKNVFWCLEDRILILKKNPIEKDINTDFSIGAVSWRFVNENIRGFKLESGIVPNKTFLDWFIQRSKSVRF